MWFISNRHMKKQSEYKWKYVGFQKELILWRCGEDELFTRGRGYFLYVSLIPATNPRLLATSLMSPLISCCKLNFRLPPFSSEAGKKMGRILLHSREIPPFVVPNCFTCLFNCFTTCNEQIKWETVSSIWSIKLNHIWVCLCLRKHLFSCAHLLPALEFVYFFLQHPTSKRRLACAISCNILMSYYHCLTRWQGGDNNPLYLHTTKMSHSQPALLDSALFEPHWREMSVI